VGTARILQHNTGRTAENDKVSSTFMFEMLIVRSSLHATYGIAGRYMNETEFYTFCRLADVVLDPFPIGGGRSSFEVFATGMEVVAYSRIQLTRVHCTGTPIVALYSRTSILQLTYGMDDPYTPAHATCGHFREL
jgi:hypothetical protein